MLMDLYQELFTANHTDFLGTVLMALVLLLGGLLFRWSAYADLKAISGRLLLAKIMVWPLLQSFQKAT